MRLHVLFLAALGGISTAAAQNYKVITDEHVDLQIVYASGSLSGRIVNDLQSYERDKALLFDGPQGTISADRPSGSEWNFLGVGAGQPIYYFPQDSEDDRISLGFASDKGTVPFGIFSTYYEADPRVAGTAAWNKITLLDVRFFPAPGESAGPAYFSLWQNDYDGNTTVWMSSFEGGITEHDAAWLMVGGHIHYNWGFSKRGYYQIDFQFSGYTNGGTTLLKSDPLTFHFGVEFMPAVIPEPGTAAMLLPGLFLLLRRPPRGKRERVPRDFS